jgi:hypothetical protein
MGETNENKKETGIARKLKFEIFIFRYALKFWINEIKFQHPIFPPICLLSGQVRIQNLSIWHWKYLYNIKNERLRWSRGSVLAFGTQVRGFKPGRSRQIFRAKKS